MRRELACSSRPSRQHHDVTPPPVPDPPVTVPARPFTCPLVCLPHLHLTQVASQAVACMPSIMLFPLLPFIFEVGLVIYWVAVTGESWAGHRDCCAVGSRPVPQWSGQGISDWGPSRHTQRHGPTCWSPAPAPLPPPCLPQLCCTAPACRPPTGAPPPATSPSPCPTWPSQTAPCVPWRRRP